MTQLADYKILFKEERSTTGAGFAIEETFDLPSGTLFVDGNQSPFITYTESVAGSTPLNILFRVNGHVIAQIDYELGGDTDGNRRFRRVFVDGTKLKEKGNELSVLQTSQSGEYKMDGAVLHFQQKNAS